MTIQSIDLDFLCKLALDAGQAILDVYGTDFGVEQKEDKSPLTLADRRSHDVIVQGLGARFPHIPILSEEGREIPYEARSKWSRFWCVDPLDGTKEFIKRNGEFTVNIALIEETKPVVGVIHIPVQGLVYVASEQEGAWEIQGDRRKKLQIPTAPPQAPVKVLKSRSHPSPHLESLLELIPDHETLQRGSALKFCSIAAGEAHFYPRLGPTCEWDTAAGQAIVTAAGGVMLDFNGLPFRYNKANVVNGPFMVACSREWLIRTGLLERAASLGV